MNSMHWLASLLPEGNREEFYGRLVSGQRLGQAFMNCLDDKSYWTLTGTTRDPFYTDDVERVLQAVEFLTSPDTT